MPDCFKEVVTALIVNSDEDTPEGKFRLTALNALCEINPAQALSTRALCVQLKAMPSLMLKLSLEDSQDLVAFLTGLLLGIDQNTRGWFAQFVKTSQKRKGDILQSLRDKLLIELNRLLSCIVNERLPDEYVVESAALLRLYCALRGIAGLKFNDEEILPLLSLVTSKPPPTPSGIHFVSLGLCMLIACPSLIGQPALEGKAAEWIQWLMREEAYFVSVSEVSASFGEMLLLMAIHFHSNQFTNISELVCSTLGMKILMRQNNASRMKQIFTQEIFTEQVVAAHAVKVPVTLNLNANIQGYLPIHCIHQLLKSRAFSKHKVAIKSWIYKQIVNSTTPLHPVMPALIEVYVNSLIAANAKVSTEQPLSEAEIQKVFSKSEIIATVGEVNLTAQLLILYYLLLYEDLRLSNMLTILQAGRQIKSYSAEFLAELPIKYLLQYAQKNQNDFEPLFSPLLRLFITHFPHLSLVDDWIEVGDRTLTKSRGKISELNVVEAFEEIQICPSKTIRLLKAMMTRSAIELWPLANTFIRYFKKILEDSVPRLIQELYKQVWIKLNTILPRHLWVMTINALMPNDTITRNAMVKQENIMIEPLQILRCDERVYRCPDALAIILRILQASLAASKIQLSRHIMDKPLFNKGGPLQNENQREELKMALVASQESVAVQILLETCLEIPEKDHGFGKDYSLREIRGIVCSYIHQVFIAEPSLAKLVHFQGYPRELLSMTVRGIPSMHICLDFISELLSMPEMDKQIFAIDLSSHLSLQYALPKSLSIAKLCINTLTTLLGILSSDTRIEMFRAVLPCIVRFAEAFPPLLDDSTQFLMQLGRIAESQAMLGRKTESMPAVIFNRIKLDEHAAKTKNAEKLVEEVRETFTKVCEEAVLKPRIF